MAPIQAGYVLTEVNRRGLGAMMVGTPDEILKLICGRLLRSMIFSGIPRSDLWPVGTDIEDYNNFPVSPSSNNQWLNEYNNHVDFLFRKYPALRLVIVFLFSSPFAARVSH